jgi:dTDP-glucose pyrophosphorylase/CBS domain-containing protein
MNQPTKIWQHAVLPQTATIHQAIRNLDEVGIQIVLVLNENGQLEGTICDGDIRRGLLRGLDLSSTIDNIASRSPLVVPEGLDRDLVVQLMTTNMVRQIPIVDETRHVLGLHLWHDIMSPHSWSNVIVVMAGGIGSRLRPHTEACPKPMLPVAGRPILEHIIRRAKLQGFNHFVLAIHYLGHMIEEYFGDGERFGVQIVYLREREPLGPAGSLSLFIEKPAMPFIVVNGDVISDIGFGELLDFHGRHDAAATMAVRLHEMRHPFGVVRMQGVEIIGFEEKPVARSHINAGVYVLAPSALDLLDRGEHCDMPSLFEKLQASGARTVAYPMHEPWLDVGRPADLERAQTLDALNHFSSF